MTINKTSPPPSSVSCFIEFCMRNTLSKSFGSEKKVWFLCSFPFGEEMEKLETQSTGSFYLELWSSLFYLGYLLRKWLFHNWLLWSCNMPPCPPGQKTQNYFLISLNLCNSKIYLLLDIASFFNPFKTLVKLGSDQCPCTTVIKWCLETFFLSIWETVSRKCLIKG